MTRSELRFCTTLLRIEKGLHQNGLDAAPASIGDIPTTVVVNFVIRRDRCKRLFVDLAEQFHQILSMSTS